MSNSCNKCQTTLLEDATFCHKCGANLTKPLSEEEIDNKNTISIGSVNKNKKMILIVVSGILVGFASISGIFFYLESVKERDYLNKLYSVSSVIVNTEDNLKKALKDKKITDSFLTKQKSELNQAKIEFNSLQVPTKYQENNNKFSQVLNNEIAIIDKMEFLISNVSNPESKALLEEVKYSYEDNKKIIPNINIPKININDSLTISNFPLLSIYINQKENEIKEKNRKIEESEKQKKEESEKITLFFNSLDGIISKYELARTDLGSILDRIRTGGFTFQDFYRAVENAREARSKLRDEVMLLEYISKDTEKLKKDLSNILTKSIDYCEVKRSGIKLEQDNGYMSQESLNKYSEADSIDLEIKNAYTKFNNDYNKAKDSFLVN